MLSVEYGFVTPARSESMPDASDPDGSSAPEWSLRRDLHVETTPDRVWPWLAVPENVSQWWCPPPTVTIDFEPTEGGHYRERYRDDETEYDIDGTIVGFVPARRFAVRRSTDDRFGDHDRIEITLAEADDGTRLTHEHAFPSLALDRRRDAEDFYSDGWAWSLDRFRSLVIEESE